MYRIIIPMTTVGSLLDDSAVGEVGVSEGTAATVDLVLTTVVL